MLEQLKRIMTSARRQDRARRVELEAEKAQNASAIERDMRILDLLENDGWRALELELREKINGCDQFLLAFQRRTENEVREALKEKQVLDLIIRYVNGTKERLDDMLAARARIDAELKAYAEE